MPKENKKLNILVEESGIITHFKATSILRKNNWPVLISPYYHDLISDSVRETDLIAEKQFNSDQRGPSVQVNIQFFMECKYIKQEVVFWFDKVDKEKAISSIEKETGLIMAYKTSGDITPEKFHYFNDDSVAKLFSTNSNKEDIIYKAMNQSLHSQINYRRTGKKPILNPFNGRIGVLDKIVQYPVIVCENFDNILEVSFNEKGEYATKKLKNHFILETNYREDHFLIDIIDINHLEIFLKAFEDEAKSLVTAYAFKKRI